MQYAGVKKKEEDFCEPVRRNFQDTLLGIKSKVQKPIYSMVSFTDGRT